MTRILTACLLAALASPVLAKGGVKDTSAPRPVTVPWQPPAPVVKPRPVQITSYWAGPTPIPTYSAPEDFGQ